MEIIRSEQGKDEMVNHVYSHTQKQTYPTEKDIQWIYHLARSKICKGAITTNSLCQQHKHPCIHNHQPSVGRMEAVRCRSQQREQAQQNPLITTSTLVAGALQNLTAAAMADIGTINAIKRDVQCHKAANRPTKPASLAPIKMWPPRTSTEGQQQLPFNFYDSGPQDPRRMLLFGSDDCLELLSLSPEWFMEGNFKMAPKLYIQLYVIRATLDEGSVSCVYALLLGKDEQNYQTMLHQILFRCQVLGYARPNPARIISDFDMAMMNCVTRIFPTTMLTGCFYHLCQGIWRLIQEIGLVQFYNGDNGVKKSVGMMVGLAFLPIQHLHVGMVIVRNRMAHMHPSLLPLCAYFMVYYVGYWAPNPLNNAMVFHQPRFPPQTWNVFNATLTGTMRPNNVCEGWNSGFKKLLNIKHPPLYSLIEGLKKDNAIARNSMQQNANGMRLRTSLKWNNIMLQLNLRRAAQAYYQGCYANNIEAYLETVAKAIQVDL